VERDRVRQDRDAGRVVASGVVRQQRAGQGGEVGTGDEGGERGDDGFS